MRLLVEDKVSRQLAISIHALHAECDAFGQTIDAVHQGFQSTHSMRSATGTSGRESGQTWNFNPRTPCGVRQDLAADLAAILRISIHALHAECDLYFTRDPGACVGFQSTHSMRSATPFQHVACRMGIISIHALHAECDLINEKGRTNRNISIHALHAECDGKQSPY